MKNLKFLSGSLAALMLATSAMVPSVAQAEVSASLAISNFYLWRGLDLSNDGIENSSAPAISGDITISGGGFYGGIWASSGDEALGQEYDLYAGWAGEFGEFSIDVSYWTYVYPSATSLQTTITALPNGTILDVDFAEIDDPIDPGDVADLVIGLGFAGVGLTIYENLEDDGAGARYVSLDYSIGDFNALVGSHDDGEDTSEHIQLSYAYNDNLSFTVSKFLDDDMFNDEVLFNIGYSFSF